MSQSFCSFVVLRAPSSNNGSVDPISSSIEFSLVHISDDDIPSVAADRFGGHQGRRSPNSPGSFGRQMWVMPAFSHAAVDAAAQLRRKIQSEKRNEMMSPRQHPVAAFRISLLLSLSSD